MVIAGDTAVSFEIRGWEKSLAVTNRCESSHLYIALCDAASNHELRSVGRSLLHVIST